MESHKSQETSDMVTQILERVRKKLLDLSRRNNLINFRETRRTIRIIDELPNEAFRQLVAEGKSMELVPFTLPEETEPTIKTDEASKQEVLPFGKQNGTIHLAKPIGTVEPSVDSSTRKLLIILGTCLIVGWAGISAAACQPAVATQKNGSSLEPLEQMAAQFRKLRSVPGHFNGGTWNDDVDRWMGPKHRLMLELSDRLGCSEFSKADIIQLLDPPDHIACKGDRLYDQIVSLPGYDDRLPAAYEFLIYYWRGQHDWLFFSCQGGVILGTDWWYGGD